MRPALAFWIITSILALALVLGFQGGYLVWFWVKFATPVSITICGVLLAVWLVGVALMAHLAKVSTQEYHAREEMTGYLKVAPADLGATVSKLLQQQIGNPAFKNSHLGAFLSRLNRLATLRQQVGTTEPLDREGLIDSYASYYTPTIHMVEKLEKSLVQIGFIGTLVGLFMALGTAEIPALADAEKMKAFISTLLTGMGVSMSTTIVGVVAAGILAIYRTFVGDGLEKLSDSLAFTLQETLAPVIQGRQPAGGTT